jgi:hypothetical protein
MIIVKLKGGLGNQMFQYAMGRALAHRNEVSLKLDISSYRVDSKRNYHLGFFNIIEEFASKQDIQHLTCPCNNLLALIFSRIRMRFTPYRLRSLLKERTFSFDPAILNATGNVVLDGYWQSERYFKGISGIIRNEFTIKDDLSNNNKRFFCEIKASNSVSLHIRRGDYVTNAESSRMHGALSLNYYLEAIKYISERVTCPHFFVFSDDNPWVTQNLRIESPCTFIEHNGPEKDYEDLWLMSHCHHHIIANSTFSWWGGWLNCYPGKIVIAPKRWFNIDIDTRDLIPEDWIRL